MDKSPVANTHFDTGEGSMAGSISPRYIELGLLLALFFQVKVTRIRCKGFLCTTSALIQM
jgi:hypothetical protein